jgi:hypothetical protein
MSGAEIALALQTFEWLATAIPKWIAASRAAGELTAAQELDFQARKKAIYAQPYAQVSTASEPGNGPVSDTPPLPGPHTVADATKPDV